MEELSCAFCGKTRREVLALVASNNGQYICNECVRVSSTIIEKSYGDRFKQFRSEIEKLKEERDDARRDWCREHEAFCFEEMGFDFWKSIREPFMVKDVDGTLEETGASELAVWRVIASDKYGQAEADRLFPQEAAKEME